MTDDDTDTPDPTETPPSPFPPFDPATVNTAASWLDADGNPVDEPVPPGDVT